jgi:hypothetical protein
MFVQGTKFSLGDKYKFGPMEVGVNSFMIDTAMREFKSLILLQTYLSHAKGPIQDDNFILLRQQKLSTILYATLCTS